MTVIYKGALRIFISIAIITLGIKAFGQTSASIKTVKVTPETVEAEVGQQVKFTATGYDTDGKPSESKAAMWFALPGDLASADSSGTVTLYGPGEVRLIALVGGKPGVATIVVKPARVKRIELTGPTAPLLVGGTIKVGAKAIGMNGDPREDVEFEWNSTNPSVATVDAAGLITGVAPGTAKLMAKVDGVSSELAIKVVL